LAFLLIGLQAEHACSHVSEGVAGANAVATQLLSGDQRAHGAAGRSILIETTKIGAPSYGKSRNFICLFNFNGWITNHVADQDFY